jgi:hypothetical protein
MSALLAFVRLMRALILAAFGLLCTLQAGPDAKVLFAPVLRHQVIRGGDRLPDGRLCFTWAFDKVRPAELVDAGWHRDGARLYPY